MRVTKIIREYVEETVNEIYNPLIKNCSKDYSEKKNEVEDILGKMTKEFDAAAKKVIKEHGFTVNSWNGEEKHIVSYTCNFGEKEYVPVREKNRKLNDEKRQKIQDILVNLELGGTKAELDEMLKNIREEVAV
jgi:hypothetical protein